MTDEMDEVLDKIHTELANKLLERLQSGEATAADFQAARQFLKEEGITGNPSNQKPGIQGLVEDLPFEDRDYHKRKAE